MAKQFVEKELVNKVKNLSRYFIAILFLPIIVYIEQRIQLQMNIASDDVLFSLSTGIVYLYSGFFPESMRL